MLSNHYVYGELGAGEKWIFNSNANSDLAADWPGLKTIRMGVQALDIDGKAIPQDCMRPVFVHESELDELDRIWTRKLAR